MTHFTPLYPNIHLVEYEDTFPFKGDLSPLAASHAYSEADISTLLALAIESGLSVIPLVIKRMVWFGIECIIYQLRPA